ncbi:glucan biosynthesis protein [Roseobacteraceae bacterium S113]
MLRREFIAGFTALATSPALAGPDATRGLKLGPPRPFDASAVIARARDLAQKPYAAPPRIPGPWTELSYDQYQRMRFDVDNALWRDDPSTPLELDVFAPGLYFPHPVEITVIEDGAAHALTFDQGVFREDPLVPQLPVDNTLGYSGLRLRAPLRRESLVEEFAVFQGASYFRAIGTGNTYGLSARGLAIDTAEPTGEEFPEFRAFWLEKPAPDATDYVLHALLDCESCTGAYRFVITPGETLQMQVQCNLFARREMAHLGLAPLTSMFQFDQTNRDRFSDFRPAVHDSDGLLVVNGAGETIWRPLANPRTLQISAFVDDNPQGFGLMQRARKFGDFADLEALYHNRPGAWITPGEGWGKGSVTLVEIPTDDEIYDNIVAYWRPAVPLAAGESHRLSYTIHWGANSAHGAGLPVLNTAIGAAHAEGIIAAIDFGPIAASGPALPDDLDEIEHRVYASTGEVSPGVLQRNPETGGPRLAFKFHPGEAQLIEFRAELWLAGERLSETWLYRWTA